jgi:NADH:ubiquinone oxidoreductase subunit 5 (subunit L)/multisubunit Na+/H+ antiporter MnhA subunit
VDLIWLIPLLPGIGAAINGVVGVRAFSKTVAGLVACTSMGAALLLSGWAFWELLGLAPEARDHVVTIATWIPRIPLATANGIGGFEVPWAFRLDPLSGMMILIVSGI